MFNHMFGSNMKLGQARAFHEQIKATGYNKGYQKAGFALQLSPREYSEKMIFPDNKKRLEPGITVNRNARNNATFIQYDRNQREDFEDRVKRYFDSLEKEERDEIERARREE